MPTAGGDHATLQLRWAEHNRAAGNLEDARTYYLKAAELFLAASGEDPDNADEHARKCAQALEAAEAVRGAAPAAQAPAAGAGAADARATAEPAPAAAPHSPARAPDAAGMGEGVAGGPLQATDNGAGVAAPAANGEAEATEALLQLLGAQQQEAAQQYAAARAAYTRCAELYMAAGQKAGDAAVREDYMRQCTEAMDCAERLAAPGGGAADPDPPLGPPEPASTPTPAPAPPAPPSEPPSAAPLPPAPTPPQPANPWAGEAEAAEALLHHMQAEACEAAGKPKEARAAYTKAAELLMAAGRKAPTPEAKESYTQQCVAAMDKAEQLQLQLQLQPATPSAPSPARTSPKPKPKPATIPSPTLGPAPAPAPAPAAVDAHALLQQGAEKANRAQALEGQGLGAEAYGVYMEAIELLLTARKWEARPAIRDALKQKLTLLMDSAERLKPQG